MIDNNDKYSLHNRWNLRIIIIYISNAIHKLSIYKHFKVYVLIYIGVIVLIWNIKSLLVSHEYRFQFISNLEELSISIMIIILMVILPLVLLFLYGKPIGAKSVSDNLHRIGLVNNAHEAPLLLSRATDSNNHNVMIMEFLSYGIPLSEWQDKQEYIESALNIKIDFIKEGRSSRHILLYAVDGKYKLPELLQWSLDNLNKNNFVLLLGESFTGDVTVDLSKIPHMLIGGSTGSGKSVLLKLLLMQCVLKDAKVYIADFKGGVDFPRIWHNRCRIITEENELQSTLLEITEELQRRKSLLSNSDCSNIDEYNNRKNGSLTRIVVGCDEIAEVLDKTGLEKSKKEIVQRIEAQFSIIARQGRAFGIHLILATQRPDATILSGQIRNNIDFRVCGRADDVLSQIILDKTDASEKIPKDARGRFLTNTDRVFQAYWFDDSAW